MATPVLDLANVSVNQAGKPILQSVSFTMFPGDLVYLVGKTGSGKTSLLRTLYADLPVAAGEAHVSGFRVHSISRQRIPFLRRKLGIIFQDFQLLTDRNIESNLRFVMQSTGWKKKALMDRRLDEVFDLVGLGHKRKNMPHELSGGEQQRVVIARALVNEPFVLLADEPTGNLDPETSREILELLVSITHQGTSLLMATHNYNLIHYHPSRVLRIEHGTLTQIEPQSLNL
ncbi:MAG: ATP-binding cassette domain-containing protein [Bacteroidetes bacterium]|jgi:cell division transport system ATP-binding protein|nr:ATP-binding cassette domain-containing protein [Bacteroidota bacterium]